jgi:hypothetical protein
MRPPTQMLKTAELLKASSPLRLASPCCRTPVPLRTPETTCCLVLPSMLALPTPPSSPPLERNVDPLAARPVRWRPSMRALPTSTLFPFPLGTECGPSCGGPALPSLQDLLPSQPPWARCGPSCVSSAQADLEFLKTSQSRRR